MLSSDEVQKRFGYHQPGSTDVADAHETVRAICATAASDLHDAVESVSDDHGREFSIVLTKLEEAMMWANAAIARNQRRVPA